MSSPLLRHSDAKLGLHDKGSFSASFFDYETLRLWDYGIFFSSSHFLIVSFSFFWTMGQWDYETMGCRDRD